MVNGEYRDYVNLDGVEVDTRGQASVAFAFTGFSHSDATSGKSLYGDTYGANFTKNIRNIIFLNFYPWFYEDMLQNENFMPFNLVSLFLSLKISKLIFWYSYGSHRVLDGPESYYTESLNKDFNEN